jgi:uncharacterized membrane protein YukC
MPLEKSQIFHIVGEIVVIVGMFVYFQIKLSSTAAKVGQLERVILEQNKKIKILDTVLQEVVKVMPPQVRNEISHRVQMVSESSPVTGTPPPRAPPPPKPQENPLSSVMNMIAPMMSSMMVAGMSGDDDQNDRVVVEEAHSVSSDISDADIAEELQELDDEPQEIDDEPQEIEKNEDNEKKNEENDDSDDKEENDENELGDPVSLDD